MVEKIINNKIVSTQGFEDIYSYKPNYFKIDGFDMHYIDKGKGKPVLMLHGNPTWSFYFRNAVDKLSPDYRTIVPDHIGCGFSDKPGIKDYKYTLKNRVSDLTKFIDYLDLKDKITLIVHDWGGMIGLAWALNNLSMIEKIIITNTSGFLLPTTKKFPLRLALIKYFTPFAIPAVLGFNLFSFCALYIAAKTSISPKVKKGLTAPYNSWKNRIATLKFVQDIPLTQADESYNIVKEVDKNLYKIKKFPILFLWGLKDFVFDKSFLNEWKKRIPDAEYHIFKNSGHYIFEDKPVETMLLIEKFINN
ncbi:MAG: alpha/beta fold hydrolase [Desulfobacteraceae bacterium]|nr:alpha/beta fold hydrolase [Desulfobacteraceae bacterium]